MTKLLAAPKPRSQVAQQSVILLEFNELSPTLIARFMDSGELPNFKRLHRESQVYVTDAEEAAPNLKPWIQWVTVHSGLPFAEHGIFNLGDGHQLDRECLWDIASDHGLKVWVCGSMNICYRQPINGCVLPDVWSTGSKPFPDEFLPYFDFVRGQVQEHTNVQSSPSKSALVKFLGFMLSHGLSAPTIIAIAKQLLGERLTGKGRWKRATVLDKLQWDVFRAYYRKLNPAFSTFFINSTAHLQHMHWRDMDPSPFKVKPTAEEQSEYECAILHGYKEMDKIVGDALAMADDRTTLILSSALGQQPCVLYEDMGGKVNYRPRDLKEVLDFAGIAQPYRIAPIMSEQFNLHFDSEADATRASERLLALRTEGRQTMLARQNGDTVLTGCFIHHRLPKDATITGPDTNQPLSFFQCFYRTEGLKSGMHHPDGILWIRRPGEKPAVLPRNVSLLDVAPTILSVLGIPKPMSMKGATLC